MSLSQSIRIKSLHRILPIGVGKIIRNYCWVSLTGCEPSGKQNPCRQLLFDVDIPRSTPVGLGEEVPAKTFEYRVRRMRHVSGRAAYFTATVEIDCVSPTGKGFQRT